MDSKSFLGFTASNANGYPFSSGHCVLVMDDEEFILDLLESMLRCFGCDIVKCVNGAEAVAQYQRAVDSGRPYLAAIMDLKMPGGMDGVEVARRIRRLDPDAKLIVSSGYAAEPVMVDHESYGFCASLPKPYSLAGLAGVLAQFF